MNQCTYRSLARHAKIATQFRLLRAVLVVAALSCLAVSAANAQRDVEPNSHFKNDFSFSDPQQFFGQIFGADSKEDREAIEKMTVPTREEQQIGKRGVDAYLAELRRRKIKVVSRGKDVDYLQQLVSLLRPQMKNAKRYRTIHVYVAESDETDARSFPGGTLIFYRGLLDFADSEAAIVGVVGHELSHLDREHQLYDAKRMKFAQKTFSGGAVSPDQFFRNGTMLMRSFTRPFRPQEESVADRDAVAWSYDAGYDPREMAALFLRMHERERAGKGMAPAFFRSHPYHIDRYQAVLDQFSQLQITQPNPKLYVGKQNLNLRTPRSVREFDE
jgi:predicted Zn-dependent protease